ncbi:MAG: energy transducer TonB [Candidatus Eremiobacteraeota bacterium]|nr:energy transducer TonB [Candidatus Eremiobacteraeota bacterium]
MVGDDYSQAKPDLFCPAFVSRVVPIHQLKLPASEKDLGTDSEFAVVLSAGSQKSISGTLKFFSKDEAFKVAFATSLNKVAPGRTSVGVSPNQSFQSPVIYVRFPAAIALDAAWVDEPLVDGKPADCATLPFVFFDQRYADKPSPGGATDADIRAHPDSNLRVQSLGKVDMHDCPQVYSDAKIVAYVSPRFPAEAKEIDAEYYEAIVANIALDAAGHIADITLLQPSHYKPFNRETLLAISKTAFAPRKFLCTPVPSFFSFRAEFKTTN